MTGGMGGAMVHRSGGGGVGGTLIQEGPAQNKQCEAMMAYGGGKKPNRPSDCTFSGRSGGSARGRIWGIKFQEIYMGCRNKYRTLHDNCCKHIP